ncbi:MAG: 50S ribosomal protein L10 [Candidatus Nomurabacteria bacterium]|jgi:large subunit ribosomal protein L10|nr:50S ribosomal protein L10 [Candidatus Nomurabacteria bacterium]
MAISRNKKNELVAELNELLASAKMTVFAEYKGVTVQDLQVLRRSAREADVAIKVVKNRLVKVAITDIKDLKDVDVTDLKGQLLYAISSDDEVAPAQVLDKFAKDHPELVTIGAFSGIGANLSAEEVKSLAGLPSKEQLIGQVVDMLLSPMGDVVSGLNGLGGILNALEAKASN